MNVFSLLLGSKAVLFNTGDVCGCHSCGEVLLASSGWLPGMLLNVCNAPGSCPMTRDYEIQNASSVADERL